MRLFLAVFPPPEAQRAAFAAEQALRRPDDAVSWVKLENLHYTLRFLGEIGEDGAGRAEQAAREAADAEPAFTAALGLAGAFPNARRARVLWLSLAEGAEPMVRLARSLDGALGRRGFGRADRPFSPHLTVGRVRAPNQDFSARLAGVAPPGPEGRFTVDRVRVVESTLSPKGSIYRVRAEAPLAR